MPEQAATAAIFGFVLSVLGVMLAHIARRERAADERLASAHKLVQDLNDRRVQEVAELMHCLRDGVNGAVVAIRETNAELIQGFGEAIREIKPVIQKSTAAIARAELVMDALGARSNGHG